MSGVINSTHRNQNGVLGDTLVLEPLAQTADGYAGRLADACVLVAKTGLDERPD